MIIARCGEASWLLQVDQAPGLIMVKEPPGGTEHFPELVGARGNQHYRLALTLMRADHDGALVGQLVRLMWAHPDRAFTFGDYHTA